jgi:hypothetical protein
MTDERRRLRCKDRYSRTSCQFSPVDEICLYSQLTHCDRQPVRTEVTKTENARTIGNDRNACLAEVGPGSENLTYPALVPNGDVHALRATPDV